MNVPSLFAYTHGMPFAWPLFVYLVLNTNTINNSIIIGARTAHTFRIYCASNRRTMNENHIIVAPRQIVRSILFQATKFA